MLLNTSIAQVVFVMNVVARSVDCSVRYGTTKDTDRFKVGATLHCMHMLLYATT
jgi:hypothetical protein